MNTATTTIAKLPQIAAFSMTSKARWTAALLFPAVVGPAWCFGWRGIDGRLGTLASLILIATLFTSAVTDVRRQRIYNWTTYSAALWAIAINLVATIAAGSDDGSFLPSLEPASIIGPHALGGIGLGECLAGGALCFLVTLIGYDLSGGGAGDVKLAGVIGLLLGVHAGIFAIGYSYVVAGIAIVVWSAWKHGPFTLAMVGLRKVARYIAPFWPHVAREEDTKILLTPVPLGPYFLIGTLLVMLEVVPT